jgi:hypothetical protein
MRTVHFRSLSTAAIAVLMFAGSAAAQSHRSVILNSLQVRQLVERGDDGDHEQLAAHFGALSERYTRDATRHRSMAQDSVGNPSRSLTTGLNAHCSRLADLNTASAITLRELAAYHNTLTSGALATAPAGGAAFQAGAGAPEPTGKEVNAMAAKASTPGDHRLLEEYFLALAKRYTAEANQHTTWAQIYQGSRIATAAPLHHQAARSLRESARAATEAAAIHKSLAKVAR